MEEIDETQTDEGEELNLSDDELKEENEDLKKQLTSLNFFTDQARYNKVIYDGLGIIMKKLDELNNSISKPIKKSSGDFGYGM